MNFNINNLIRENVKTMKPYSSARDEYVSDGSKMVFLDANENPFENGVNRYPDPQQRNLKQVIAEQKNVDASQILLGNGSDEVLDLLFRAFCEPKQDLVLTLPPTYGMYTVLANLNEIEEYKIELLPNFVLNKIKPPYNVNELTQRKALERVLDTNTVQGEIEAILTERNILIEALKTIPYVTTIYPSEANFVLAKVDNANKRYDQLLAKGIVIRNRTTQVLCENTLRFTVGTAEENETLIKNLKALKN